MNAFYPKELKYWEFYWPKMNKNFIALVWRKNSPNLLPRLARTGKNFCYGWLMLECSA
jgi:hypothetical protein